MIKQGHRLVADDVVRITRVASGRIVGTAPEATKYLIEVRGIGIVDVRYLFGVGSAVNEKSIDFIMDLEMFDPTAQYERIGAREKRTELLGVDIPTTVLPVSPGRNIAVVVEVAARNFLLKSLGTTLRAILQNAWKAYLREKKMNKAGYDIGFDVGGSHIAGALFSGEKELMRLQTPYPKNEPDKASGIIAQ